MTMLLVIIWVLMLIKLILLAALRPRHTTHSWFELGRLDNKTAMHRELLLSDLNALRQFLFGVTILLLTGIGVVLWQWWGVSAVIISLVVSQFLGSQKFVQRTVTKLYMPQEPRLLHFVDLFPFVGRMLGSERLAPRDQRLESTEQLLHLVESAGHILSDDQRRIIHRGLDWHTTPIRKVMTPRRDIMSIKRRELLGPLVLDDLHRSGYSRFPVMQDNIDNVVGVLDITDLLEVDGAKNSQTAEKIMSRQAVKVNVDDSLPVALSKLQKTRHNLLIVVDEDGNTIGLVTLTDILSSLLIK